MTKLLERAIEQAKLLPNQRQDEIGEMVLALIEQDTSELRLSDAQIKEVERRLADPGPRVSEQDAFAFFRSLIK